MDAFCWELESSERDTSNVARVDSSTNSRCLHHCQKLFCKDYYLNILAYPKEYFIYHDYWSNHLVLNLEQRHKVGRMNSHNQMNSCHYCYYVLHFWCPKLSPRRARGDQHGSWFPDASAFCKANTGQPKVCTFFMLLPTRIELKSSSLDVPSSSTGRLLWRCAALHNAYGLRAKWTALGQRARVWSNCLRTLSKRLQMACSAMPFWKCAFTPQKVSFCCALWHACWSALSWNYPMLQW